MKKEKYILAVDIGASQTSLGLVSERGEIFFSRLEQTKLEKGKPLVERILENAEVLFKKAKEENLRVKGIAIGSPGIVNHKLGIVVVAGNIPELFGAELGEIFTNRFGVPTVVENDVNAMALGEMVFGVAKGQRNFIVFALGTDLGGGIVIDGKLYRGANFIASEFGHLTLDLHGERCICGGFGCAREYVSGDGLAKRAREEAPSDSLILKLCDGDRNKITAKEVFSAYKQKDMFAEMLLEEFGRRFGALVANVMKVLDPEVVVLAGEVCHSEPNIIELVVRWTRHYYFPIPKLPEFKLSQFSKSQAVLGPSAVFMVEHGIWKPERD